MKTEIRYTPILEALAEAAPGPFAELKRKRLIAAIKATEPDFTTRGGFRWPFPGHWAEASRPLPGHTGPCPSAEGDGLCVAKDMAGASQGGFSAHHLLVVGYRKADALGEDDRKVRVSKVWVAGLISPTRIARIGAYLSRANLSEANLYGAELSGANLSEANLYGAELSGADLYGAIR